MCDGKRLNLQFAHFENFMVTDNVEFWIEMRVVRKFCLQKSNGKLGYALVRQYTVAKGGNRRLFGREEWAKLADLDML